MTTSTKREVVAKVSIEERERMYAIADLFNEIYSKLQTEMETHPCEELGLSINCSAFWEIIKTAMEITEILKMEEK